MRVLLYGQDNQKAESLGNVIARIDSVDLDVARNEEEFLTKLRSASQSIGIEPDLLVIRVSPDDNSTLALLGILVSESHEMPVVCVLEESSEEEAVKLIKYGAGDVLFETDADEVQLKNTFVRVTARSFSGGQLQTKMSDFVLTNSFDGVLALDLHMRVMLWNRSMERMFAKKRLSVLGKIATDVLPFEGIAHELKRAMGGESYAGMRKVFINREQKRYYQPFYAPLISRTGSVIGVMGIFRDLTELVEKENEIVELKARLSKVADSIPQMLWIADASGERNFFNKRYLEFAGAKSSHLVDEGWLMAVRPDQRSTYTRVLKEAIEKKQGFHIEYQMRNHENTYRRVMDSCAPVSGENGKFLGFIGYCTDMSSSGTTMHRMDALTGTRSFSDLGGKQKRRRRSTNDQISSTMENAPLGVWKLDRDLNILTVSRSAAGQLGCDPEDLKGKKFTDTVKNISEDSLLEVMNERSSFQLNAHVIDMNGESKSEGARFWDVAAWPLLDRAKEVIGVCLSTIEVEGREEDKGKEAFVATLVHDLKTPLIGADRTLEMLIDGSMGEFEGAQSEVLSMLQRSNRGLLRMVQNLIEVYRYDFAKPKFDFVSTSLFDRALDCVNELSALAEEKNVNLEANLVEGQGMVEIDELSVKRVIINLIDNAIKFTPQGGLVRVWGEETPNTVTIFVKDSGIGISQDEIPRVFDKFWRSPTNTGQAVGTGLGLYLCKQVIDAHQGEISVEPGQEKGTLMKISLNI